MASALTRIRKRARLTQAELAKRLHTSQQQVWRLENGTRRMTFDWAERIAAALNVAPADLLDQRTTHVVGYVGAGAEVIPFDDHPQGGGLDEVLCPPGLDPAKTVAVRVTGDSMSPLIQDGWLVFYCRDPASDAAAVIGKTCVVKLTDGRMLLKQVRRGADSTWNLLSINAPMIEGVQIEWASPIRCIMPPDLTAADADTTPEQPVDNQDGEENITLVEVRREIEAGLDRGHVNLSPEQMNAVVAMVYEKVSAGQKRATERLADSAVPAGKKDTPTRRL